MPNRRGSILIVVILMLSVMALMVGVVGNDSMINLRNVGKNSRDKQAKYAAYAGLQDVMNELAKEPKYKAPTGTHTGHLPNLADMAYEVFVTNNMEGTGNLTAKDGTEVLPNTVYLEATGMNEKNGQVVAIAGMVGLARKTRPVFDDGAYARSRLHLSGDSYIDAWNSTNSGEYSNGTGTGNNSGPGNVEPLKASIGGEAIGPASILVGGTTELDGQVVVGPNSSGAGTSSLSTTDSTGTADSTGTVDDGSTAIPPAVLIDDGALVLGTPQIATNDTTTQIPRFQAPYHPDDATAHVTIDPPTPQKPKDAPPDWKPGPAEQVLPPGAYDTVYVRPGKTLVLQSGAYYIKNILTVDGGDVRVDKNTGEPCTMFLGGQAVLKNANVNERGKPLDLQMCFTDDIADEATIQSILSSMFGSKAGADIWEQLWAESGEGVKEVKASFVDVDGGRVQACIAGYNLIGDFRNTEFLGAMMGREFYIRDMSLHQDLALEGAELLASGSWSLEGVHQVAR